jgi:hypothetical protein
MTALQLQSIYEQKANSIPRRSGVKMLRGTNSIIITFQVILHNLARIMVLLTEENLYSLSLLACRRWLTKLKVMRQENV